MLAITNLTKSFGGRPLFEEASLVVNRGERVGLIGRNGHGKSTLLRMISHQDTPDDGSIALEKDTKVGILEQYFEFKGQTTLKEAESALPLLEGAYRETFKAERILEGLGFDEKLRESPPKQLSGGFQIRLNLCKLLLSEPDLLLLDEPTNYLDIVSVRWLENFLLGWTGAAIVVSHDRTFIDKVSTHIALIYRRDIRKTTGTTEKLYERIAEEEAIHEKTRLNQQKEIDRQEAFIRTYRSKARQASRVQSRVKALERTDRIEKLESEEELQFDFAYQEFNPKWILHTKSLGFGYDEHPLFSDLTVSLGAKDRIAIIGQNGKGKSTLLSVLYGALAAQTGSAEVHSAASVGYLGQSNIERLHPDKTVEQVLLEVEKNSNRTRARTIAGCMLFSGESAEKEIKVLSGGEKTRVHLGRIIARPTNLLFLDEPTNHLDFYASQALLEALARYPGAVVLVTHDEEFLRKIASRLIVFKRGSARLFEGGYEDFLRREGWEEEGNTPLPSASNEYSQQSTLGKKELRKLKANINQEKSDALKPLKKTLEKTEKAIEDHELAIKEEEAELLEITVSGFNDRAAELSRSISKRKGAIEELFETLESVTAELEEKEKSFQQKLQELESL
ncbi:MAG: ATP-binding cassette domain-containing protein [Bdellovibrionales bacterium]|nr:ATP-binding cassette domain-containing protein [Bdellovibrionales bacterium]